MLSINLEYIFIANAIFVNEPKIRIFYYNFI